MMFKPSCFSRTVRQSCISIAIMALLYFLAAKLVFTSLRLGIEPSPVWPPAGIALFVLLHQGRRVWPGVALGILLVGQWLGVPSMLSWSSALGGTVESVLAVTLLRRVDFRNSLERLRDVLYFLIVAGLLAPIFNATISTASMIFHSLSWEQAGQTWWTFWLGDCIGILVFTPLLLVLQTQLSKQWGRWRQQDLRITQTAHLSELLLCFSLLIVSSWIVFHSHPDRVIVNYPIDYLPFPFVIWAALRLGQTAGIVASFLLSIIAISGTVAGMGPFVALTSMTRIDASRQVIFLQQAFLAVVTTTALILAAATSERRRVEEKLRLNAERNRLLSEMALRIRQSLDLEHILNTTVQEVRQVLQADRVFICRFDQIGNGRVVAEAVLPEWNPILDMTCDASVYAEIQEVFAEEPICVVNNTALQERTAFIRQYHDRYQVKAGIGVAIVSDPKGQITSSKPTVNSRLFGVLIAHQCSRSRQWQPLEIELLEQLGIQVAIAIQQGQLYQQVQRLNSNLEYQVAERTLQLQVNLTKLEEMNELQNVFLHAIAHDLRTTVMGTLLILKTSQQQPGHQIAIPRSLLEKMIDSGEIQLCKLNSLLEAYTNRIEGLVLQPEITQLEPLLQTVITDLKPHLEQNQAQIKLDLNHVSLIHADPDQLKRVFKHLLINAVKHNLPGIQVTIRAETEPERLRFTVTDNGKGIQISHPERLFDLKTRSGSEDKQLTGIGVGLCLCQQIITAHGGEIGVDTKAGSGSCFWFTLPCPR